MVSLTLTEVNRKNNCTPKKVEILCLIKKRKAFDTFIHHKTFNSKPFFFLLQQPMSVFPPIRDKQHCPTQNTNHPKKRREI
jgi:hypothetical protein